MTLRKAVKMIEKLRDCELATIDIITGDMKIAQDMRLMAKGKADYLDHILHELVPKSHPCKHPSKLRDVDPDGRPYCIGCNQNL